MPHCVRAGARDALNRLLVAYARVGRRATQQLQVRLALLMTASHTPGRRAQQPRKGGGRARSSRARVAWSSEVGAEVWRGLGFGADVAEKLSTKFVEQLLDMHAHVCHRGRDEVQAAIVRRRKVGNHAVRG